MSQQSVGLHSALGSLLNATNMELLVLQKDIFQLKGYIFCVDDAASALSSLKRSGCKSNVQGVLCAQYATFLIIVYNII